MDCVGKSDGAESLIGNEKPMPVQWKRGNDQLSITKFNGQRQRNRRRLMRTKKSKKPICASGAITFGLQIPG
jgi:hypothetical protein